MTVLEPSTNPAHRTIDQTRRIRLGVRVHGAEAHQRLVDGAWWPRSLDLAAEWPDLIDALTGTSFDARRVSYSLAGWQQVPRRLNASGRVVELVVMPPGSDKSFAARVLAAGRDVGDMRRAVEILEAGVQTA